MQFWYSQARDELWVSYSAVLVTPLIVNLHFPDGKLCKISFRMLMCYSYIFFAEVSVKIFGPFHDQVVFLLPTCNVGDLVSVPGLERFPGEGKGYPLQYTVLENSLDY